MKSLSLAFAVLLLAPTAVLSQTDPAIPALLDPPSCAGWIRGPSLEDKRWLLGYMSGLNTLHTMADQRPPNPIIRLGNAEQIYEKVLKDCQRSPGRTVALAGLQVFLGVIREAVKDQ
jgi:hypothetical protein